MMDVVIGLDLSGEGAVSDFKKLLQGFIWTERGHARDLADFLLANALLTPADLDEARQVAAENERRGVCELARQRLQYRPKAKDQRPTQPGLARRLAVARIAGHGPALLGLGLLWLAGRGPWPRPRG